MSVIRIESSVKKSVFGKEDGIVGEADIIVGKEVRNVGKEARIVSKDYSVVAKESQIKRKKMPGQLPFLDFNELTSMEMKGNCGRRTNFLFPNTKTESSCIEYVKYEHSAQVTKAFLSNQFPVES